MPASRTLTKKRAADLAASIRFCKIMSTAEAKDRGDTYPYFVGGLQQTIVSLVRELSGEQASLAVQTEFLREPTPEECEAYRVKTAKRHAEWEARKQISANA